MSDTEKLALIIDKLGLHIDISLIPGDAHRPILDSLRETLSTIVEDL